MTVESIPRPGAAMEKIYRNEKYPSIECPKLDLLTLLFDSEHCLAREETLLHASAVEPSQSLNKQQLRHLSQRIARCLKVDFDIGNSSGHDVVTVVSDGQPAAPAVFFGVIAAGGIYSAASASLTVDELVHQLQQAQTRVLICSESTKRLAQEAGARVNITFETIIVLSSSPVWSLTRSSNGEELLKQFTVNFPKSGDIHDLRERTIAIVWSSGTSGLPKGVRLSHQNLVTQVHLIHYQGREHAAEQVRQGTYQGFESRTLAHLPASHISGLFGYFISHFYGAGAVFWMAKYEWNAFLRYCRQHKITSLFTVPSIWLRIAKSSDVTDQFTYLRESSSGSAPMDANLQVGVSQRLAMTQGRVVVPSWGLSETTGAVTFTPSHRDNEYGSLGPILPCLELRLVDDDLNDVEEQEPGELLVRGPTVTRGYFNDEPATKAAFHNGWFCTGDIAVRKVNGQLFMVDRKKELLKYKGLQIAPAELEHILNTHPAILEAAVIGVPSLQDPGTELPRAYVVRQQVACEVSEDEIKHYVRSRVADYKRLRGGVVFTDSIPKSVSGKILRKKLREVATQNSRRSIAKL